MNTPRPRAPPVPSAAVLFHYDKGRNGRHPEEIHHSCHPKQGHEGPAAPDTVTPMPEPHQQGFPHAPLRAILVL